MPLLVAAATDQTGRTITMLSAGLVAVAVGLTLLTIWYWRFTSPRRRLAAVESSSTAGSTDREPPIAAVPAADEPIVDEPTDDEPVVARSVGDRLVAADPVSASTDDSPPPLGFDDDQWALITQAVLDEYRES